MQPFSKLTRRSLSSVSMDETAWTSLSSENGCALKKRVLEKGSEDESVITKGSLVKIEYVGTLAGEEDWTVEDVINCWISNMQGMTDDDTIVSAFRENGVDGAVLLNPDVFTEEYVAQTLGVSNRIRCKKLIMAAKRLAAQQTDFPMGTEFDSSLSRGRPFEFTLGSGKAIKAIDTAVGTMKVGERAEIIGRADYCYGAEGYRTGEGKVVVPPFATLQFNIKVLE